MTKTCPDCKRPFPTTAHEEVTDGYCWSDFSCVRAQLASAQAELADVAYLDDAACRHGTRLDIPAKIPGFDPGDGSDHLHFVLMPIGAASRRAAVEWLKAQLPETTESE